MAALTYFFSNNNNNKQTCENCWSLQLAVDRKDRVGAAALSLFFHHKFTTGLLLTAFLTNEKVKRKQYAPHDKNERLAMVCFHAAAKVQFPSKKYQPKAMKHL